MSFWDDAPRQRHSDTSTAAAEAVRPKVPVLRARVLAAIRDARLAGGLTDEEIQDATGIGPSTQRPRRVELVEAGLVRDGGKRRKTRSGRAAVVWEAV